MSDRRRARHEHLLAKDARPIARLCCQWPFGEVGTKEFRFCGEAVEAPGRPYCTEHAARAFVAPPGRVRPF